MQFDVRFSYFIYLYIYISFHFHSIFYLQRKPICRRAAARFNVRCFLYFAIVVVELVATLDSARVPYFRPRRRRRKQVRRLGINQPNTGRKTMMAKWLEWLDERRRLSGITTISGLLFVALTSLPSPGYSRRLQICSTAPSPLYSNFWRGEAQSGGFIAATKAVYPEIT